MRKFWPFFTLFALCVAFPCCSEEQPAPKANPDKPKQEVNAEKVIPSLQEQLDEYDRKRDEELHAQASRLIDDMTVVLTPSEMPLTGTKFSWNESLVLGLFYWKREAETYGNEKHFFHMRVGEISSFSDLENLRNRYKSWRHEVFAAYGLFQMGNSPIWLPEYKKSARKIFDSDVLREKIYVWAIPHIRDTYAKMPAKDRRDYMLIFQRAAEYLRNEQWSMDRAWITELVNCECRSEQWQQEHFKVPDWIHEAPSIPCTYLFTHFGPDGRDEMRKVNAFLYRRIEEGYDANVMLAMTERLISDLSPKK